MSSQVERTRKARGLTFLFGRLLDPQDSSRSGEIHSRPCRCKAEQIIRDISKTKTNWTYLEGTPR